MNVFNLRNEPIRDYKAFSRNIVRIRDQKIKDYVDDELKSGALWPDPLIQLNPQFEEGDSVQQISVKGVLDPLCADMFRSNKSKEKPIGVAGLYADTRPTPPLVATLIVGDLFPRLIFWPNIARYHY